MAENPLALFKAQLDEGDSELAAALPDAAALARFKRATLTAVQQQPEILKVDRRSLFLALTRCANDGLTPDGREAAITPFRDREKGYVAVYLPMVQGIIGRLRATKSVLTIKAVQVFEQEIAQNRFAILEGTGAQIRHEPILIGDRGPLVGVYAIAQISQDPPMFEWEWMTVDDMKAVEAMSRSSKGPWKGPFRSEMEKKTVIRRLAKRLTLPPEVADIFSRDDDIYDLEAEPASSESDASPTTRLKALSVRASVARNVTNEAETQPKPKAKKEKPDPEPDSEPGTIAKESPQLAALISKIKAADADEAQEIFDDAVTSDEFSDAELQEAWDALTAVTE